MKLYLVVLYLRQDEGMELFGVYQSREKAEARIAALAKTSRFLEIEEVMLDEDCNL